MPNDLQTTTLTAVRFESIGDRLWAFAQMGLARRTLARTPDLGFWKLFGTGGGEGFRPSPNTSVYAILATWPSPEIAEERLATAPVFQRYRARASEWATLFLDRARVRGAWDGRSPFDSSTSMAPGQGAVAVLTRATIRPRHVLRFWRHAPGIDLQTAQEPAILFKLGMGEVPGLRQVTFSIWRDAKAMTEFAYRHPAHREAARAAKEGRWFSEDLFARFRLAHAEGAWLGRPLSDLISHSSADRTTDRLCRTIDKDRVNQC